MGKVYGILVAIMLFCIGCQWQLKPNSMDADEQNVSIQRYDRIERAYLTTGDYSALQQMNSTYPNQTRMLIEDVLQLGQVDDRDINHKFLRFFQDSTLQEMLDEVQEQYEDMNDISSDLSQAFERLREELPGISVPEVYTQIGSFDQSIVVGNNTLGISLDKYLGADYPFYKEHYTEQQRSMMVRNMIVPDCLSFYLLSLFPNPSSKESSLSERYQHMGKIQWVVNQVMQSDVFNNTFVNDVAHYMQHHKDLSYRQLLQ